MSTSEVTVNEPNLWRLATPGHAGWTRTARPGDPRKYLVVSADAHANEPADLWATRIDAKYRDRVPKVIVAIERTMNDLSDQARARILGLNAARLFGFDVAALRPRVGDRA